MRRRPSNPIVFLNILKTLSLRHAVSFGTALASGGERLTLVVAPALEDWLVNLVIWMPAMFALGLATLAALFAFVYGCEKV
jgi:hypothetical protein